MDLSNRQLLPWQQLCSPVEVLVIGDIILDEYLDGDVNRISPEAPVPIHLVQKRTLLAGGAGNVARNIQLAGGRALLASVWGSDEAQKALETILKEDGISSDLIYIDSERPTIRKTRVASNHHQVIRIDWEEIAPIRPSLQDQLFSAISSLEYRAILLSDYAKGCLPYDFVRRIIQMANSRQIPVIVDPKGRDYTKYQGAHLITPNRKEALEALGLDSSAPLEPSKIAVMLQERYKLHHVLITLGGDGMILLGGLAAQDQALAAAKPIYLHTQAREVFDVSGAGDTVVALMALGVASGCTLEAAMNLANLGAGRVVEKWGTQPITAAELKSAWQHQVSQNLPQNRQYTTKSASKIVTCQQAEEILKNYRNQQATIVFTNGCFDILHAGHVSYLEQARELGDLLVVGLNSDASIARLKGADRPIVNLHDRALLLAALSAVDLVVEFTEDTPIELIKTLIPNILVKGSDYQTNNIVGADIVTKAGGLVATLPFVDGLSTSNIINKIKSLEK